MAKGECLPGASREEAATCERALAYARKHKKRIAERLTDRDRYPSEKKPVSVFMAGAPGAGKTEASKELIRKLTGDEEGIIRVDPDDLRSEFKEYYGGNSWLFQPAVSVLVEKVHDLALKQKQSFLLDGTLSSYTNAKQNIGRSVKRKRPVQILYVYQEPLLAWDVVVKRERIEGRNVRPEDFLDQYFGSREAVNQLKKDFGRNIRVDLLVKNTRGGQRLYEANVHRIDDFIPEKYTREQVASILDIRGGS